MAEGIIGKGSSTGGTDQHGKGNSTGGVDKTDKSNSTGGIDQHGKGNSTGGTDKQSKDQTKEATSAKRGSRSSKAEKSPLERSLHGRKCVGCGEFAGKKELLRVVKNQEGGILIDPTGKMNGRGAYLHKSAECSAAAKKKHALERALKCDGKSAEAIYNSLVAAYDG
jgi:predicted RNA-binding protein YlxR (DUF448 family)